MQEPEAGKRGHILEYIDICRRIQLRAEGKIFVTGFIMGLSPGAALKFEE